MRDHHKNRDACNAYRADLAELSLGVLSGDDRSSVLEHVVGCVDCSTELEQFSICADAMLQLAPEVEPPLGFEQRAVKRARATKDTSWRRSSRSQRAVLLAAAAVVIAVAGVGIGRLVIPQPAARPGVAAFGDLTTARLTSAEGKMQGEVFVSPGKPAWLFMTVNSGTMSGMVRCTVTLANGKVETVGSVYLSNGYGAWGGALSVPGSRLRSTQVVSSTGTVLATAAL